MADGTPWIAVPNRRCVACGGLSKLVFREWLNSGDAQGVLSKVMPFECEDCHRREDVPTEQGITSSGRIDL